MTAIAGLRGTGDWGTDERPKNFREMILWLSPNGNAPLTALMAKMGKAGTDDPEFAWWEETLGLLRLTLNDADDMAAGDTAVVVDSGANDLNIGDLLMVETTVTTSFANEMVRVTGRTSDTQFTIARGQAGTTAATIADDTAFLAVGTTFEEGSTSPNSSTRNPTKFLNYCQIFKKSYELTNTAKKTASRTGDPKANDKRRRMFDHSRDLELATIFGQRNETAAGPTGGKPIRQMGGLLYFLAAKTTSRIKVRAGAYTSLTGWADDTFDVYDYTGDGNTGGDERIVLCGNGALNIFNKLAKADGTVNYGDVIKQWGMNFTRLVLPQGSMMFKSHPLLNQHATFTNMALIIDPPGIRWRPLRDTKSQDGIQAKDADTDKGQWLTEAGVEFDHLETMKAVTNITI